VRLSNATVLHDSDNTVYSYLAELRNIAVNSRLLSPTTLSGFKQAKVLIGSRRVRRQQYDQVTDHIGGDEEDQDLEYDLRAADQVAIVDDMIAFQQFGGDIFCAPQEDILEGEYGSTYPRYSASTSETVDFYRSLGCKQLSDLVLEVPRGTNEIFGSKAAQGVRSLILERLPFFLEHHGNATQVTTWLSEKGNFIVRMFKEVMTTRSIDFAGAKSTISVVTSATTRRKGQGPMELWLADNTRMDMYEIATSLGHSLFRTWKVHHALLLMTILSSDLHTLWRRGYNSEFKDSSIS